MSRDPASSSKQQAPDLRVHALLGKDLPRGQVLVAIQKVLAGEVLPKPWSKRRSPTVRSETCWLPCWVRSRWPIQTSMPALFQGCVRMADPVEA